MVLLIYFILTSAVMLLSGVALIVLATISNDRRNALIGVGYTLLGGICLALFLSFIL